MRKIALIAIAFTMLMSCGGKEEKSKSTDETVVPAGDEAPMTVSDYDPNRGEGKFDKVDLSPTLDKALAKKGEEVAGVKCMSCHKPTEEKLVGPGWKGVTERRKPEWIMNFITNPDPMIDKDPELQAQLEICLVRMPNQGLSDDEARNILEYMRQIDGVQ